MKIISIELGRAAQSFVPDEFLPPAGLYIPEVIQLVSERYGFAVRPDVEAATKQGAHFRDGRLIAGNKKINITELAVFNDGVFVHTKNTTDADFVVDDILNWAKHIFAFRDPLTHISRKYESAIVVEFDRAITSAFRAFEKIRHRIADVLRETYGATVDIDLSKIAFASDQPASVELHRSEFLIERRIGRPFSENRFYCTAPLRTETHIQLLETFEREMPVAD